MSCWLDWTKRASMMPSVRMSVFVLHLKLQSRCCSASVLADCCGVAPSVSLSLCSMQVSVDSCSRCYQQYAAV